jgi:hypothetical protein
MGIGIQIAGALAILVAYALAQFDVLNQHACGPIAAAERHGHPRGDALVT